MSRLMMVLGLVVVLVAIWRPHVAVWLFWIGGAMMFLGIGLVVVDVLADEADDPDERDDAPWLS